MPLLVPPRVLLLVLVPPLVLLLVLALLAIRAASRPTWPGLAQTAWATGLGLGLARAPVPHHLERMKVARWCRIGRLA